MILLARQNKQRERLALIEQALQEKAPRMHRELQESGQLQMFLEVHETTLMELFEAAEDEAQARIFRTSTDDFRAQVKRLEEAERNAWQEALNLVLDFREAPLPGVWCTAMPQREKVIEFGGWPG